jgi:hypothetical protein
MDCIFVTESVTVAAALSCVALQASVEQGILLHGFRNIVTNT